MALGRLQFLSAIEALDRYLRLLPQPRGVHWSVQAQGGVAHVIIWVLTNSKDPNRAGVTDGVKIEVAELERIYRSCDAVTLRNIWKRIAGVVKNILKAVRDAGLQVVGDPRGSPLLLEETRKQNDEVVEETMNA